MINPLTKRRIQMGGATHLKLVRNGILGQYGGTGPVYDDPMDEPMSLDLPMDDDLMDDLMILFEDLIDEFPASYEHNYDLSRDNPDNAIADMIQDLVVLGILREGSPAHREFVQRALDLGVPNMAGRAHLSL